MSEVVRALPHSSQVTALAPKRSPKSVARSRERFAT